MVETVVWYGIRPMLRTRNDQPSLWGAVLPEVCLRLPAELERVDVWLDDERFFAPFRAHFDARLGRPSVPVETYLRLMFLKFRYRLGFESLCAEVADSISWRRFCRIDIDARVPHPTTLMKITTPSPQRRPRNHPHAPPPAPHRGPHRELLFQVEVIIAFRCWPRRRRRATGSRPAA